MKFLSAGDKAARERAEQRGDTITARSDSTFTQANAVMYLRVRRVAQVKRQSRADEEEDGSVQPCVGKVR
jgi:hypothetical protein